MNTAHLITLVRDLATASGAGLLDILLGVSLRGSVLILVAWAATRLLARGSAALRHLIWASALGGMLFMPLFGALTPAIRVGVIPSLPTLPTRTIEPASRQTPAVATMQTARQTVVEQPRKPMIVDQPFGRQDASAVAPPSLNTTQLLSLLWAAGALLLLLRLALGMLRVSMWTRRARAIDDGRWLTLVHRLGSELCIARPVTLLRSDRACVPMTWGVVYPIVLLPTDADEWTVERGTIVLLHELAHVKRFDAFTQTVVQIAVSAFWFNPLVWVAARHIRTEREHACDDLVLRGGARASDYAADLLQIARSLGDSSAPAAAALAMARRSEIEGRLLAILDPKTNRRHVSRARLAAASAGVFALALPLAALAPAVHTETTDVRPAGIREDSSAVRDGQARDREVRETQVVAPRVSHPINGSTNVTTEPMPSLRDSSIIDSETLTGALPGATYAAASDARAIDSKPAVAVILPGHQPARFDLETLISVTRAAAHLTSDYEKAELLITVANHYIRDDALRTAYLDAVSTMTSDRDRSRALGPWLLKDSLPASAVAHVVKVISSMTSDDIRAGLITRVASDHAALTAPTRAALIATLASFTSDYDRGRTIAAIAKTGDLTTGDVTALIMATIPMTSDYEKANALIVLARGNRLDDAAARKAYFRSAETMTSSYDYRRTISEVLK